MHWEKFSQLFNYIHTICATFPLNQLQDKKQQRHKVHVNGLTIILRLCGYKWSRYCSWSLTRAPLGYFYNAPHWGGGGYFEPPSDLRNYRTDSKNSSGIWKPWKNCRGKTNFIDLGVTSDVTGKVKVKMFDISGLVTSASKNCDVKHKQSQLISMDSVSDICKCHFLCFMTIIEVKVMSGHQVKKVKQTNFVI